MGLSVDEKIKYAKVKLLTSNKFFGALLLYFPLKEDNSMETAYTNNVYIGYNSKWFDGLSKEEVLGVVTHELLHIYFKHFIRFDIKTIENREKVNMALDYAINHIIKYEMNIFLPNDVLISDEYKGWNAEKIFNHLKSQKGNGSGGNGSGGNGSGGNGSKIDKSHQKSFSKTKEQMKKDGKTKEIADRDIQDKIVRAFSGLSEKEKGDLPDSVKRDINDFFEKLKGRVNWKKFIKNKLRDLGKETYAPKKYNKKWLHKGIYLPALEGLKGRIALALDTSGSISDVEMKDFLGEMKHILQLFPNLEILTYGCDSVLQGKSNIKGLRQFKQKDLSKVLKGEIKRILKCYFALQTVTLILTILRTQVDLEHFGYCLKVVRK